MKKNVRIRKILFILILFIVIAMVLCFVFNPEKAINLILPKINKISYVYIDLKKDTSLVKLTAYIQNKMPYRMVIDTIHFEIKLNGLNIIEESIPVLINQSRFSTDSIELPIHCSINNIKKIIAGLHGQDSTYLDASFYIVYNTFIGKKKLRFNKRIEIATPVPLQLKILEVEFKNYKFINKTSEALIRVEIINKGKYIDLQLNNIEYNFQIKNTFFSEGIYKGTIQVKPTSCVIVEIPIVIEFINPSKTVWKILHDKDQSKYVLNLQSIVKIKNFNNTAIAVEVDATGNMELVK